MKNRVTKPGLVKMNQSSHHCQYCDKVTNIGNLKKHEAHCYLNPAVSKFCANCGKVIKNYKSSKGTCSRSCANTHFKSGLQNGNWKGTQYQTVCFLTHEKACIICGEDKIVAVHHYDEDHSNNDPSNLVPLCPTHHQYVHSRYKNLVIDKIDKYVVAQQTKRSFA